MDQQPRTTLKDPGNLSFKQPRIRKLILISYWVVVLLATPLWWVTTSIERLPLPRLPTQLRNKPDAPIRVNLASTSLKNLVDDVAHVLKSKHENLNNPLINLVHEPARFAEPNASTVLVADDLKHPVLESRHILIPPIDATVQRVSDILLALSTPYSVDYHSQGFRHLVAKFSSRYRLAFTLLNEDASHGKAITGWDIQGALIRHINPVLDRLSGLHNFTVESQIQFYAPIAFETNAIGPNATERGISPDKLKVFVNSADWTLASQVSNDPVLHFLIFVPSAKYGPLRILDDSGDVTLSNAFILPQWGGIIIANQPPDTTVNRFLSTSDLEDTFSTFRLQLSTLVGISKLPSDIEIVGTTSTISDWQLDTLYRERALENMESSHETLESIGKLVDQIPNMPVGQDVKGDFLGALNALRMARDASIQSPTLALQHSAQALTLASRAFFNPGMLALLYFPPEHTYAIYTPLFAPMMVPLLATTYREFTSWKKARKYR